MCYHRRQKGGEVSGRPRNKGGPGGGAVGQIRVNGRGAPSLSPSREEEENSPTRRGEGRRRAGGLPLASVVFTRRSSIKLSYPREKKKKGERSDSPSLLVEDTEGGGERVSSFPQEEEG